jgi:hypothetical protein
MTMSTPRVPWVWFTMDSGEPGMSCQSHIAAWSHSHIILHNSYFSGAEAPPVAYPEGFQGNEIPLDGEVVAQLVHRRLSLAEEADD